MSERSPSPRKGKRFLPQVPKGAIFSQASKSVTFNSETVETSIGGTETIGRTKQVPLSPSNSIDIGIGFSKDVNRGDNSVDLSLSSDIEGELDKNIQASFNMKNDIKNHTNCEDKENFITPGKTKRRNTLDDSCNSSKFKTPPMSGTLSRRFTLDEKILGTPECFSAVQMDSLKYELFNDELKSSARGEDSSSVTVAVRVRPYSQR